MCSLLKTSIITLVLYPAVALSQPSQTVKHEGYLVSSEHIPSPNLGRITAINRDHRGYLWFGTTRGLCKYDGYRVRVVETGLPRNELQQNITTMLQMDRLSLLVGTARGVWSFDLHTEQFRQFLPGMKFSEDRISALVLDTALHSNRTLWIGTSSHGLFRYDLSTEALLHYTTSNGLSDDRINTLLRDSSGRLWIGTETGGLNMIDQSSRIVHYRAKEADPGTLWSDCVVALCENSSRELWIGTNVGLNILDLTGGHMLRADLRSYMKQTIGSIAEAPLRTRRMWISASELGLLTFSSGAFARVTTSDGSASNPAVAHVIVLYVDPVLSDSSRLLLWVGTRTGVERIVMSKSPFANHIRGQGGLVLDRGAVLSFCEDKEGILWLGLWGGGLEALRRTHQGYVRVSHYEHRRADPSSLPHNDVGHLLEDRNGVLWVGTPAGLMTLDKRRKHLVSHTHRSGDSNSLPSNRINALYEDRSGTIWVGTAAGLSRLVSGTHNFTHYLDDPDDGHSLGGNLVSHILEDREGSLWIATYGRGLNKLDPNGALTRILHQPDSTGTGENWIYTIAEGAEGMLWLSTGAGLVSFDPESGRYTRHATDQFRNIHIFDIFVDRFAALWLSTTVGLIKFTPRIQSMVRYGKTHGMPFNEMRSHFFRDSQGKLFVGSLDGFTEFFPDSVSTFTQPPEIVITSLSVFDRELPAATLSTGRLRFAYDENALTFSFAVLDYLHPSQNMFAYQMEGIDRDWVDVGTRNSVIYANIEPGEYIFRVKGRNSEGVWNEAGTSLAITITPPFWGTWWFRVLVAIVVATALYAAYRYRLHKLLEVERLRLRIAEDLHDDVGSNLSTIAMVSRSIQRAPELTPDTRRKLDDVFETAVSTSEGMRDIVWFIKPENDSLDDLLLRMKDTASSLLNEIEHELHAPMEGISGRVTVEFRRNFFLAFKEALTNIVRHAGATRVHIRISQREGMLEATVQDNGRGFDGATAQRGNGLGNLHRRSQAIGGTCEVSSRPGKGTTVRFSGRL